MAILSPIIAKFSATVGVPKEVYSCPAGKSHAIIDLSFFKDDTVGTSMVTVALSTDANPANLQTVDYFLDDIEMSGTFNLAELNKIVVGAGERLYVKVLSGPDVSVRVVGMEESNPKILKAGRLGASVVSGTSQTQVFYNNLANNAYTSCSVTLYNASATNSAEISAWISTAITPTAADKILKFTIPLQDTTILENVLLAPNERIFIQSTQANAEFFINGMCVSV